MDDESRLAHSMCGQSTLRHDDEAIARLATRQHGVVARAQLVELGLSARQIEHRIALGRLRPVHRGVYAVGHDALSQHGRWMAATLLRGPDAVLSHRAACALLGLRASSVVEVTSPRKLARPGIVAHVGVVPHDERTVHDGILTTTAARALLDIAPRLTVQQLERAVDEAEIRRLAGPLSIAELIARYPRRPGTPKLREILRRGGLGLNVTRSELEAAFLAIVDAAGLERPIMNERVEGFLVDAAWPADRLVVELDGFTTHRTRRAFRADRRRDRVLGARGWRPHRFAWEDVFLEPDRTGRELHRLLAVARSRR